MPDSAAIDDGRDDSRWATHAADDDCRPISYLMMLYLLLLMLDASAAFAFGSCIAGDCR